jgi:hypothetical protein
MACVAVIFLLALGASAEVPEWMAPSKFKHMPKVASKIMAPMRSFQSRLQTPNNRRLQAIMSDACAAACPGAEDLVKMIMEMATAETTPPPAGVDENVGMVAMCPYIDALICVGTTPDCQDEEPDPEDDPAAVKCFCDCPDLVASLAPIEHGDFGELCGNKAGTIDCIESKSSCAKMKEDMNPDQMNLMCESAAKGCMKANENLPECVGPDAGEWAKECEPHTQDKAKLTEIKDTCCPIGKKMVECMGEECMKLVAASAEFEENQGQEYDNLREVCPDAGLPTEAEVAATISSVKAGDGSAGQSGDFATPSQSASVVGMAVTMAAFFA